MADFTAFNKAGLIEARLEGVDFRSIGGRRPLEALEDRCAVEDEWVEVEEEVEEAVEDLVQAASAPSEADVSRYVLSTVNDLSDEPLDLDGSFTDGLDSISLSLLSTKLSSEFRVQFSMGELMELETVKGLVHGVLQKAPPPEPSRLPGRTKRVVRKKVLRKRSAFAAAGDAFEDRLDADAPKEPAIEAGMRIVVAGLEKRPEMNGRRGVALGYLVSEDRWQVRLEGETISKLLRAANLAPIDLSQADPGLKVIAANDGGLFVYIVHSLGLDLMDPRYVEMAAPSGQLQALHLTAVEYDDEAALCGSVPALAALYARRVLQDFRGKTGIARGGLVSIMGCSFGSAVAHGVALRLSDVDKDLVVKLVLFDLDLAQPPTSDLVRRCGRDWLGGEVEVALLHARLLGGQAFADVEERRLLSLSLEARRAPGEAEDLVMRTFWAHAAKSGASARGFAELVRSLGEKYDRLHGLTSNFVPERMFQGEVDFVMSPEAEALAELDFQAAAWDGRARGAA